MKATAQNPADDQQSHFRRVIAAAWPGCLIAAAILSFFLPKAFTIDDPIFLMGGQQAALTPAHPMAFDTCWDATGIPRRMSHYIPFAPLMPLLLSPVVRSASPEVTGHLLQLAILMVALAATASTALRLGLTVNQAMFATALTATSPAVLGMAATVMPDILALALGVLAVERFLAWKRHGGRWNAVAAVTFLILAPLARPHLALMMPACAALCVAEVSWDWVRFEWRRLIPGLSLISAAVLVYFALYFLAREAGAASSAGSGLVHLSPSAIVRRAISFGCFLALTSSFVIGFFLLHKRHSIWILPALILATVPIFLLSGHVVFQVAPLSALGFLALGWSLFQICKRRTGQAWALAAWCIFPFAVFIYMQMAAKYLVPSMPAYSIVLVTLAGNRPLTRWVCAVMVSLSIAASSLIATADNTAANMARFAVNQWLPPLEASGKRIFFQGQWSLQWYAQQHAARCFDPLSATALAPGDFAIVETIGTSGFPQKLYPSAHKIDSISNREPTGLVLDNRRCAGFYSDGFGPFPWCREPAGTLRFELWKVE